MGQAFSTNRPGGECVCGCGGGWERRTPAVNEDVTAALPDEQIANSSSVQRYVSALTERTIPLSSPSVPAASPAPAPPLPLCACNAASASQRCVPQPVSRRARLAWPLRRNAARHQGCVCTAYRRVDHEPLEASTALISEVERERERRLEEREMRLAREAAEQQQSDKQTRQVTPYATTVISRCTTCNDDTLATVLAVRAHELRQELDVLTGLHTRGDGESSDGGDSSGSTADLFLVSVAAHPDLSRVDAEDCDESARVRRAIEIAQGVEPPPGYRPHFQVVRALVMRAPSSLAPTAPPPPPPHDIPQHRVHTQVDYIHCLVPDLRAITACCFYWGKMDRYEAERLLDNKPEGTFLLRDSAQEEHLFSVSFRKYGRSLHARIEHFNHMFSFDSHDPAVFAAKTVTGLIEHYKDPACVMFFEPMLTAPLPRAAPFGLQQLARAVIVSKTTYDGIDELPLPNRLKSYLKEYHYRQRVRTKRFENDVSSSRTLLLTTGECLPPNYFTT